MREHDHGIPSDHTSYICMVSAGHNAVLLVLLVICLPLSQMRKILLAVMASLFVGLSILSPPYIIETPMRLTSLYFLAVLLAAIPLSCADDAADSAHWKKALSKVKQKIKWWQGCLQSSLIIRGMKESEDMKMKFCQCCEDMPMEGANYGKEKDGTLSEDYCEYCYADGEFTNSVQNGWDDWTMCAIPCWGLIQL